MTRAVKNVPMCVVSIGYHAELLMPADKGMKLVALLQESLLVERDYHATARKIYVPGEIPEVQYTAVKPDQVVVPQASSTPQRRKGPLLLEDN